MSIDFPPSGRAEWIAPIYGASRQGTRLPGVQTKREPGFFGAFSPGTRVQEVMCDQSEADVIANSSRCCWEFLQFCFTFDQFASGVEGFF